MIILIKKNRAIISGLVIFLLLIFGCKNENTQNASILKLDISVLELAEEDSMYTVLKYIGEYSLKFSALPIVSPSGIDYIFINYQKKIIEIQLNAFGEKSLNNYLQKNEGRSVFIFLDNKFICLYEIPLSMKMINKLMIALPE